MVGLLGQTIDWVGEDNMWYCLLSDGPDFQINVRVTTPLKEEFPNRQLVSAISLLNNNGHTLVIEVNDPYSTQTVGCPKESSAPCLADGGVRLFVDGEAHGANKYPGQPSNLSGRVAVSAANLSPECRPFDGDRIWAAQVETATAARPSLRTVKPVTPFKQWILEGDTLADPTSCAKLLGEVGAEGLLTAPGNLMTARIEMKAAIIRVNIGVGSFKLGAGPDGSLLDSEMNVWQTDLGFDMLHLSDTVTGLLGETSTYMFDREGLPVATGLGALHAPVENYLVNGPFGRVFGENSPVNANASASV